MSEADEPTERPATRDGANPLRGSRTSRFWVALIALIVILILLVVFVAQNTRAVQLSFLGWDWHPPLAVALLVAVVGGLAISATVGTLRLMQVHRRVRRTR
ncbi:lipopolysaccharide assembly protein LapA domain-containing protein [Nocardioides cynanchi]|uniref:lipopolysaccharide assembly protein LapA domain-containing protein n=1 Tax=Nocardioides cynanchi TaxID=2558918 RepID=UPI001243AB55|nr:lipopolysaccharide assembly protein LapA domain-containing protein [Nocardioides cynanchi]